MKQYLLRVCNRFGFVSLIVFATVAFGERWMYAHLGLLGAYLVWTILFIGLGSVVLKPLANHTISAKRFYTIFGAGFLLYAAGWMAAYFILRGVVGEWVGSFAGSVLLGLSLAAGFKAWQLALRICAVLFIANSIGYFLGDAINEAIGGQMGMLLWGVSYGIFLGFGIGISFYLLQKPDLQQ